MALYPGSAQKKFSFYMHVASYEANLVWKHFSEVFWHKLF